MAGKKVSRKKLLKEPDEFISITGKVIQFLRGHQRQFILAGVIALAALAAAAGGFSYFRWQEGKAREVQEQGFKLYEEAFGKGGNTEGEKESYRKAQEKFREALAVYSRGNTGQVSHLYIGHCRYALKEYDQAIEAYSRCLTSPFRPTALDGIGYCYEAKGDFTRALEHYQKNTEEKHSPFQGEGLLGMARCYEALNQKPKALETYQKALAKNPKSNMAQFIQRKIGELKG